MTTNNMQLARHAVKLYSCDLATLRTNKHNRRQWLRAVQMLGNRWLLAVPVKRETLQ